MYSSNLISLLRTFSKEEFRDFGKFVRSPFFNSHKDMIRYYSYLKKFHPLFSHKSFSGENAFRFVYPGRNFKNSDFLKLNSGLYQLGNEFLKCLPDKFSDDFKLLSSYVDRNLGKQFKALYSRFKDYLNNESELDNLIFVKKIQLETANIRYHMNGDRQKDICETIVERGNNFAYQSLMWIMIQLRDMTTNYNAYNYPYENSNAYKFIRSVDIEKIIGEIEYEDNKLGRYLKYYLYCLLITIHIDNEYYFEQFKQSFNNIYNEVNRLEKNNYLARLQTYVMKHVQNWNMKYVNELLDAYKFFFSQKGIFENDIIPLPPFRNSIILAIYVKDHSFAHELVEIYALRLNPDFREDAEKLCRAYIYFEEKNYGRIIETLSSFKFKYAPHKFDVKQLLLKTYFENSDFDYLIPYNDSFRHLITNNRNISEKHKKQFSNLISLTNQITNLKLKDNKKELIRLKAEILDKEYDLLIFDKIWLIEKIDEILK